jgi:hypothetical protein
LDFLYLASLSEDVLPALSQLYQEYPGQQELVGATIACHASNKNYYDYQDTFEGGYPWQSFHLSRFWAQREWGNIITSSTITLPRVWNDFTVDRYHRLTYDNYLYIDGERINCSSYNSWD